MLILVVIGLSLAVFFYVGGMFLQGYIYTEPSQELYWQAPAAAGALTVFLMLWCVLVVNAEGANKSDIPYDTIFKFQPRVDLLKEPAQQIWVIKDGEKKLYKRKRFEQNKYRYFDTTTDRPLRDSDLPPRTKPPGVEPDIIELEDIDGERYLFHRAPSSEGSYEEFVSDQGWVMKAYEDGPTGNPSKFRWGRFMMALFLNFGFFLLWWLCLWLLLRFQWGHALGLGFVLWLVFTFALLPMLLTQAADVAQRNAAAARQVARRQPNHVRRQPDHVLARMCMMSPSWTI
jgi:hypothetical protein